MAITLATDIRQAPKARIYKRNFYGRHHYFIFDKVHKETNSLEKNEDIYGIHKSEHDDLLVNKATTKEAFAQLWLRFG